MVPCPRFCTKKPAHANSARREHYRSITYLFPTPCGFPNPTLFASLCLAPCRAVGRGDTSRPIRGSAAPFTPWGPHPTTVVETGRFLKDRGQLMPESDRMNLVAFVAQIRGQEI